MGRETSSFVTVVSGVPRSGTSLMMRMLGAGGMELLTDESRPPDADNPGGYFEFAPAKALARDSSWLPRAEGRAVKVVHALVSQLPTDRAYRILLMRRDLSEVLRSQHAMLARTGSEDALPEDELIRVFRAQLARVETWAKVTDSASLLSVDFTDLVAIPEAVVARVVDFLGRDLDAPAMARQVEPSLYRQRVRSNPEKGRA